MCVCVFVYEILGEEHRQRVFENRVLKKISLICDKVVTTQNLAFLSLCECVCVCVCVCLCMKY